VTRIVSLVVLLAILLVIAALTLKVMADFLIPIFLALLLVVMFGPVHRWFVAKCKGHDRLAAGLTTAAILLIALIPMSLILTQAALEAKAFFGKGDAAPATTQPGRKKAPIQKKAPVQQAGDAEGLQLNLNMEGVANKAVEMAGKVGLSLKPSAVEDWLKKKLQEFLMPLAMRTPGYLGRLALGIFVMIVSLYYFLVDGPEMIRTIMRLSPLDDRYEEQLISQFDQLSRAVVIATLLSAFTQGILAGIGFYFAGVDSVFLLMVLTMLLALIPFIGAAAVWVPVCLWLFFVDNSPVAAILLAVYGAAIISMADNVIKPLVLHGQAKLHPLLALLSVLGGVTALGPIGIFVGPMIVAFLQTLLNMVHKELDTLGEGLGAGG